MKVVIFSRYPRYDKLVWKEKALRGLTGMGIKPAAIIYGNTGILSALKWGLKRYGVKGMFNKKRDLGKKRVGIEVKGYSRKLKSVARELNIPVYYIKNHNGARCKKILKTIKPDLILLWGAGIIRKEILGIPKIGTLNGHYAILPKIRGMNVTEWSILLGEQVGVTIHFVTPGVDMGDILLIKQFNIEKGDTLDSIRYKCQVTTSRGFIRVVSDINEGKHRPIKQHQNEGKQYFEMNSLLRNVVVRMLESTGPG